jgi:hypothetical protein
MKLFLFLLPHFHHYPDRTFKMKKLRKKIWKEFVKKILDGSIQLLFPFSYFQYLLLLWNEWMRRCRGPKLVNGEKMNIP